MARRLLGADNAATVFNIQEPEEELAEQVLQFSNINCTAINKIAIFLLK